MTHWPGSTKFPFREKNGKIEHDVFVRGEGPPILILQELPGFGSKAVALAEQIITEGFRVYFPHLLGPLGKESNVQAILNIARNYCMLREFHFLAGGRQSPIANWMRDLCQEISDREGGAKIGVIGMCMTGSFAIPLIAEPAVAGSVASQPSLPLNPNKGMHMSQRDIDKAKDALRQKWPSIAMRYREDRVCKPKHLSDLVETFGDLLDAKEYPERPDRTGKRPAHALLTVDQHPEAYSKVISYFRERLAPT